jgi:hypothetical protein
MTLSKFFKSHWGVLLSYHLFHNFIHACQFENVDA